MDRRGNDYGGGENAVAHRVADSKNRCTAESLSTPLCARIVLRRSLERPEATFFMIWSAVARHRFAVTRHVAPF